MLVQLFISFFYINTHFIYYHFIVMPCNIGDYLHRISNGLASMLKMSKENIFKFKTWDFYYLSFQVQNYLICHLSILRYEDFVFSKFKGCGCGQNYGLGLLFNIWQTWSCVVPFESLVILFLQVQCQVTFSAMYRIVWGLHMKINQELYPPPPFYTTTTTKTLSSYLNKNVIPK